MPIYEYQCQKCGEVSEYIQKMSDDPMTACEHCGGDLERLISRSAFHLKGGGWYKDLYSSAKANGKSAPSSGAAATASTAASSADSSSSSAAASTDAKPSKSSASGGSGKSS